MVLGGEMVSRWRCALSPVVPGLRGLASQHIISHRMPAAIFFVLKLCMLALTTLLIALKADGKCKEWSGAGSQCKGFRCLLQGWWTCLGPGRLRRFTCFAA